MKHFYFQLLLLISGIGVVKAQHPELVGSYPVGEQAISFVDANLNQPTVSAYLWYPATSAGNQTPFASGQFPVVVFGHGFNMSYLDYKNLCSHYASHGYIVAAPDVQNGFSVDHQEYAHEMIAVKDYLLNSGNDNTSILYQHISGTSAIMGHSMGGGSAYLAAGIDTSLDAVIGLAAAETTPSCIQSLQTNQVPFQGIGGSQDNVCPESTNLQPMYAAVIGEKHWVSLTGGAHCKFTDTTTLCDLFSGAGTLSRSTQRSLTKRYTTSFLEYYLKGNTQWVSFICGDSITSDIGAGIVSAQYQVNACYPLSISESENNFERVIIYPNPSNGKVFLSGINFPVNCRVYDVTGKLVLVKEITDELSLESLTSGVYTIHAGEEKPLKVVILPEN
jgi:dienelactone hydrolase